jgi:hypothetical protein
MGTGCSLPEVKAAGAWSHSSPSSAEANNDWSCTSTFPFAYLSSTETGVPFKCLWGGDVMILQYWYFIMFDKWQWESLEMWRFVCRWVNTPGLFTFQKKIVPSTSGSEGPNAHGTNWLQTAAPQQCICADCLASIPSHLQAVHTCISTSWTIYPSDEGSVSEM